MDGCPDWTWNLENFPCNPIASSFTAAHCDGSGEEKLVCATSTNCSGWMLHHENAGVQRGFPCGEIGDDGIYEHVCGTGRYTYLAEGYRDGYNCDDSLANGYGSKCVPTS